MESTQRDIVVIHSVIWIADIGVLIGLPLITVIYGLYYHDIKSFIPLIIIEFVIGLIGYFISQTRKLIVDRNKQLITINNGFGNTVDLPFGSVTSVTQGKEYITLRFDSKDSNLFRLNYNFYMENDQKKILSLIKENNPKAEIVS